MTTTSNTIDQNNAVKLAAIALNITLRVMKNFKVSRTRRVRINRMNLSGRKIVRFIPVDESAGCIKYKSMLVESTKTVSNI
eukprot:CAMPEP_0115198298 /NCGR_PEP_ID=MMETSP0270-20121206/16033_1 /TAXON_ID=71861 /ORGANISM="Scrippsiella trochoidea, Strain CCMP3099" /LENGTH=80 /DNA_ID=CAMNT_0002611665 /DNA_START=50 /DNA_END=292 /DNA_ORIENTATION=+